MSEEENEKEDNIIIEDDPNEDDNVSLALNALLHLECLRI